jgi:choline transport protein
VNGHHYCNSANRCVVDYISEFAPRSHQKFLGYIVDWLAALGCQSLVAMTAYSSAVIILPMVSISHPAYTMQNWHQSLLMIGIGIIGTLTNTYGAGRLTNLQGLVLVVHIFGFFCIAIPLRVLAPKAPTSEVFGSFENFGGWPSISTAYFIGTLAATGSFVGSDAAVNMAEATMDASQSVLKAIMFTIMLNGTIGFVFIITYVCSRHSHHEPNVITNAYLVQCFCITNLDSVVMSKSPFPFVDVRSRVHSNPPETRC